MSRALQRSAQPLCDSGHPALAAEAAARLIALDPLSDAGHIVLTQARAGLGDASGIEAACVACAELLRAELGVKPSAAVDAAYERARSMLADGLQPEPAATRPPPIRFADTSNGSVACLELGTGPVTLLILFGILSHIEVAGGKSRASARCSGARRSVFASCSWTAAAPACPNASRWNKACAAVSPTSMRFARRWARTRSGCSATRLLRQSASKNSLPHLLRAFSRMDVRERLPQRRVPTLVLALGEVERFIEGVAARP